MNNTDNLLCRSIGRAQAAQRRRAVSERLAGPVGGRMDSRERGHRAHFAASAVFVIVVVHDRDAAQGNRIGGDDQRPRPTAAATSRRPPLGRHDAETVQLHAPPSAAAAAADAPRTRPTRPDRTQRCGHKREADDVQRSHTRELRVNAHRVPCCTYIIIFRVIIVL